MLLESKVAIVVGGGQTPGATIGNGRATAIQFAREGAKVLIADREISSAKETAAMISQEGGEAIACLTDVRNETDIRDMIKIAIDTWGKIDILHNNVGVSIAGHDGRIEDMQPESFNLLVEINLRAMILSTKHVLPHMRDAGSGVIINISSMAARKAYPLVGYKTTKAAVIALTEQTAALNAKYGIRANVILPGLMNTPMAVDSRVSERKSREEVAAERDAQVPLRQKMGTAWDVAHAAAFLASDRANFITGISLPVDGGTSLL